MDSTKTYSIKDLAVASGANYQTLYTWVRHLKLVPGPDTLVSMSLLYSEDGYRTALKATRKLIRAKAAQRKQVKAAPLQ